MKKILWFIPLCLLLLSCGEEEDLSIYRQKPGNLFDDSFVHEARFYFYEEQTWEDLYKNKKLRDSLEVTKYLPVRLILDSLLMDSIGIRFKGESSFLYSSNHRRSFKISLDRFSKNRSYGDIKTFNLNNGFKDPTMLREKIQLDFLRAQKLPAPASSFIRVFVNDEYIGLYLLTQEIGTRFLDEHFTNHDGNLYLGEPSAYLNDLGEDPSAYIRKYKKKKTGNDTTYRDLAVFIGGLNKKFKKNKDRKYAEHLDEILNTDQMLKTWAINNLFVNPDAFNMLYRHNYALYHEPSGGKFQWITWDYNLGFAAWNPKFKLEEVYGIAPDHAEPFEEDHFQKRILSNSVLKARYMRYLASLLKDPFSIDQLGAKIDHWAALIRPHITADTLRGFSPEEFEKNLKEHLGDPTDPGAFTPGLKSFIIKRRDFLIRELKRQKFFEEEPRS